MNVGVLGTSRLTCTILIKETTLNNKVKHKELYPPLPDPRLTLFGWILHMARRKSHLPFAHETTYLIHVLMSNLITAHLA